MLSQFRSTEKKSSSGLLKSNKHVFNQTVALFYEQQRQNGVLNSCERTTASQYRTNLKKMKTFHKTRNTDQTSSGVSSNTALTI